MGFNHVVFIKFPVVIRLFCEKCLLFLNKFNKFTQNNFTGKKGWAPRVTVDGQGTRVLIMFTNRRVVRLVRFPEFRVRARVLVRDDDDDDALLRQRSPQ